MNAEERAEVIAQVALFVLALSLLILGVHGYVNNLWAIDRADFTNLNGRLVLRVVGTVVFPLGIVLGYV